MKMGHNFLKYMDAAKGIPKANSWQYSPSSGKKENFK